MLNFPKSLTINACEKVLTQISNNDSNEPLLLPVGTSKYAFGGLAAAIQTVNTWARKSNNRILQLRESDAKNELAELVARPHKLSAAMFANSIVFTSKKDEDLRPNVYALAKTEIENQSFNKYGQQHGRLCWFAFVDHSSKGFDQNFYLYNTITKPEPRQQAQFDAVIKAMIEKSMQVAGGAAPLTFHKLSQLGRIFYELFLNTHEHGSRNRSRSEWLKPGMRSIYTQGINLTQEGLEGFTKDQPVLSSFINAVINKVSDNTQSRFVEISITDSGLGYCGRWLADHKDEINYTESLSLQNEYEIFKKCFNFRQTSSFRDNKGAGLAAVMDNLTALNGFMRIRSGRLSLYRDFILSPYQGLDDDCSFSDWTTGKPANTDVTLMPPATGVAITLLIPLEARQ